MIDYLISLDKQLFFFLNGLHAPWMDQIMFWISDKKIWIPFYLLIAAWIIKTYKYKSLIYLVAIGLIITFTDQILSGFMKGYFARWRPSRDPELHNMVHTVNGYEGGSYGFASSHSGNTFALAMFIFLLFREYKWTWLMFIWAGVVSYSRIYLGVHYPGDIIVGAIIGMGIAKLFHYLAEKVMIRYYSKTN